MHSPSYWYGVMMGVFVGGAVANAIWLVIANVKGWV